MEPTDEFFEVLPLITGEFETFARGRGDDLYRIREYMPEDSARHVDWKATAKSGSLKVREFSREDERKVRLVFDNPSPGTVSEQAYENAVTLAASLAGTSPKGILEAVLWHRDTGREATSANFWRTWPRSSRRLAPLLCSTPWSSLTTTTSFLPLGREEPFQPTCWVARTSFLSEQ